jgi:hypothetical protein
VIWFEISICVLAAIAVFFMLTIVWSGLQLRHDPMDYDRWLLMHISCIRWLWRDLVVLAAVILAMEASSIGIFGRELTPLFGTHLVLIGLFVGFFFVTRRLSQGNGTRGQSHCFFAYSTTMALAGAIATGMVMLFVGY